MGNEHYTGRPAPRQRLRASVLPGFRLIQAILLDMIVFKI